MLCVIGVYNLVFSCFNFLVSLLDDELMFVGFVVRVVFIKVMC